MWHMAIIGFIITIIKIKTSLRSHAIYDTHSHKSHPIIRKKNYVGTTSKFIQNQIPLRDHSHLVPGHQHWVPKLKMKKKKKVS